MHNKKAIKAAKHPEKGVGIKHPKKQDNQES